MNRFTSAAVILALASGCTQTTTVTSTAGQATVATAATFNAGGAPTIEISVPEMVCEHCSQSVHEILAKQPGVKDVKVTLEKKVATVAVDEDEFHADEAIAALVDMQYKEAKLISAARGLKGDEPTRDPGDSGAPEHTAEGKAKS